MKKPNQSKYFFILEIQGCWTINSEFLNVDLLGSISANTIVECQQACQNNATCEFFQMCEPYGCNLFKSVVKSVKCNIQCSTGPKFC